MAWYSNLITNLRAPQSREKDVTGGFEVLTRLTAPDFNSTGALEAYSKSLYVFACISKIAEKVSSIELEMFRVLNSSGDTKEVKNHPALDLLYRCNPFQTRAEFWETTLINLKCTGDAFWLKVRNNGGKVMEIWNLRPDFVTIETDPVMFVKGYKFQRSDGVTVNIPAEDVVHFKYPDPLSQYTGLSPLKAAQRRIQTEDYATAFQRDFFLNSARPDAVIKNPQTSLTTTQKRDIKEGWDKKFRGLGNSSKVAILEGGLDYQLISISQKEMDYIESLKFTRDDILAAFKVPKPIVAIVDDVNRANSETAMAIFLGETIKPEIARMVEKINEALIYPDFGEEFYLDFVDPTPDNREAATLEYASALQNNWMLINEVREKEGMAPIVGGWSMYQPLTTVPVGGLPQGKGKAFAGGDTPDTAYERMPESKKRVCDFKGKLFLQQKFEIKEAIEKSILDAQQKVLKRAAKKVKKGSKKKVKAAPLSLIKGTELRKAYADIVNKSIDLHEEKLSEGMNEFARAQHVRVATALKKKAVKGTKAVSVEVSEIFNVEKETELSVTFIMPYLETFMKDFGNQAMDTVAPQEDFTTTAGVQKLLKKRAQNFGESVTTTTHDKLAATLAEGIGAGEGLTELSDRVGMVFEEYPTYRSDMVARTESTGVNGEASKEAFRQSGVANGKEWISAGDGSVRDSHASIDGEIVELDANFANGLDFPGDPQGDAGEVINCRCVMGPAFVE